MMKTVRFAVPLLVTTFGFAACATAEIYYPWCAVLNAGGAPACQWNRRLLRAKSVLYAAFAKTVSAPIQATRLKLDEEPR